MDKPITFSAPMIRALLAGRKTQTRRVLTPPPEHRQIYDWKGKRLYDGEARLWCWKGHVGHDNWASITDQLSPALPYAPGDRLWVREHWFTWGIFDDLAPSKLTGNEGISYIADNHGKHRAGRYRHALHMPRWASRLTLTVTDVRVQRVQEISHADCEAEGIECDGEHMDDFNWAEHAQAVGGSVGCAPEIYPFKRLWNSIHGPDAWDRNDWVAAYTFTVDRKNIDA